MGLAALEVRIASNPAEGDLVPLDDLVGITSKTQPLCRTDRTRRACVDYADFRKNGGVEYSSGSDEAMDCSGKKARESGLDFWRGRCDPAKALARMHTLTNWSALVVPNRPAK